jgi:hypothetical protein
MTNSPVHRSEDGFSRWQQISIKQLSFAINLVVVLATGSLGFALSLLSSDKFSPSSCAKVFYDFGCIAMLTSIGLGIWAVINRLRDFRLTAQIAKEREEKPDGEKLKEMRTLSDKLGGNSWILFWCQLCCFLAGVVLVSISLSIVFRDKLL